MKFTSKAGVNQRVRLGMQSEHIGIDYPASQIDYLVSWAWPVACRVLRVCAFIIRIVVVLW